MCRPRGSPRSADDVLEGGAERAAAPLEPLQGDALVAPRGASSQGEGNTPVSENENKELLRRYYEDVVSTGAVDDVPRYVSANYVEVHDNERHAIGVEGAKAHIRGVRDTYPDLRLTVEQQIAEGEWVATRVTMRGTQRGEWQGIRPTGKRIEVTTVNVDRVLDGRIVEHGGAANLLGPLLDAGAVVRSGDA